MHTYTYTDTHTITLTCKQKNTDHMNFPHMSTEVEWVHLDAYLDLG